MCSGCRSAGAASGMSGPMRRGIWDLFTASSGVAGPVLMVAPLIRSARWWSKLRVSPTLAASLYSRSADLFLGITFNIVLYALLILWIASECDLNVGDSVHTFGDCHLYHSPLTADIVFEQLRREPKTLPQLYIKRRPGILFAYQ